ncbi:hypothetical protein [Butyrivibrio sp. XBB1001]|uniref:hypothetical protein n=1 Tax=Butyrivibrio sp. XBB1001 TaxID=1280682 RepID=UPI000422B7A3|nr:hypothetical protein [Butyrivibrio sp. XBB1001]
MSMIGAIGSGYGAYAGFSMSTGAASEAKPILNPSESTQKAPGKLSSPAECETCKNRKYQDGSDEMVSFKSAQHISPESAAARVRGHEAEHVSNAYKDAAMNNGKVLQASVSIKTAVCPECGRTYVCGGETATKIKYSNEDNPYQQARKSIDKQGLLGANIDLAG